MPDQDPADAIRARIAAVEAEIARLEGERDRLHRALLALTEKFYRANSDNMSNTPMHPLVQEQYSKGADASTAVKRFLGVCYEAGIPSLRVLAEMARKRFGTKTQQAHLSFGLQGTRPIDEYLTKWIAEQTVSEKHPKGFESTKANWPKLRTGRVAPQPKKKPSH